MLLHGGTIVKPLNRLISALFILCLLFTMPPLSVTANASDNGSRQMSFPLTEAEIETLAAGTAFDGREYGVSTEVHDQGSSNLCWAYAVTHASEASVSRAGLSAGKEPPRLSPAHVGYSRYARSIDPITTTVFWKTDIKIGAAEPDTPAGLFPFSPSGADR